MKMNHANTLDVKEGIYYNFETDYLFTLENKKIKIGTIEGIFFSSYLYDIHSLDGFDEQLYLPKIRNIIKIGEL
jgi:hypothetical protein